MRKKVLLLTLLLMLVMVGSILDQSYSISKSPPKRHRTTTTSRTSSTGTTTTSRTSSTRTLTETVTTTLTETVTTTLTETTSMTTSRTSQSDLTIAVSPAEGGLTNPPSGYYLYDSGSSVMVTETPSAGYEFDHWDLDGSNVGSSPVCTVVVGSSHILTAIFRQNVSQSVQWLHTSGIYIYNEGDQRINLYCVCFFYGGGQGLTLTDIQNVKALGFNAFRIHVSWGLMQPYNETLNGVDGSYFTTAKAPLNHGFDEVVNWAVQENLYVIICLGWSKTWRPPSWAFPGVLDDAQRYASLINGTASKERTGIINTWKYIANRYRDIPNVMFEFLNDVSVSDESLAGNDYKSFNEEIISAIESVETNSHLKMVELIHKRGDWIEIVDTAVDINKPNTLWAMHYYYPMNGWDPNGSYWHGSFTWHGQYFPADWGNATTYVAWRLIRVADKIHSWNKPWINTEFSKNVTQTGWDVWFDAVLSVQAEYNIAGWTIFCYCSDPTSEAGWNIKDPTTQQLFMGKLQPYMLKR